MTSIPRPIPARGSAATHSFTFRHSESAITLLYILNNIIAQDLHSHFGRAVEDMGLEEIDALLASFKAAGIVTGRAQQAAQDITDYHCMWCHEKYQERNNGLNACRKMHCEPQAFPAVKPFQVATNTNAHRDKSGHGAVATPGDKNKEQAQNQNTSASQGLQLMVQYTCCGLRVPAGATVKKYCFKGRHTTSAEKAGRQNLRITTCKQRGCVPVATLPATAEVVKLEKVSSSNLT